MWLFGYPFVILIEITTQTINLNFHQDMIISLNNEDE